MAASPTQFDLIAGLDLEALSAPQKSELMQAINQIEPVGNIGLAIKFSSLNGTVWPGISNNPRFARFIWLDSFTNPPTPKVYNGVGDTYASWEAVGLGDAAVLESHIAVDAVVLLDDDGTNKIALRYDGAGDPTRIGYLLTLDSNGDKVITKALADVLTSGSVPLSALAPGTNRYFLRMSGGNWVAELVDFAAELSDGSVVAAKLSSSGGSPGWFLRVNAAATALELVSNSDITSNLFPARSIAPNKISPGGAVSGDILRFDSDDWIAVTPSIDLTSDIAISREGIESLNDLDTIEHIIPHGLGTLPKQFRCVIKNISPEHGYVPNPVLGASEVDCHNVFRSTAGTTPHEGTPGISVSASASNIYVTVLPDRLGILNRASGNIEVLTNTSWIPKVYAWA